MFAGRAAQEVKKTTRPAKEAKEVYARRAAPPPAAGSRLLFLVNRSPAEWTGASLSDVLAAAGVRPDTVEIVFTGADHGTQGDLEHDYARMWLVAARRIVASWASLGRKRRAVQALRSVPDAEIFARWPLHLVATYPGDEELFGSDFFRMLLPVEPRLVPTTLEEIARG